MTTTPGEQVGAVVDGAVADAKDTAALEIAVAKENAEAAQRNARAIADAAISTELGNQIQSVRQENETWRTAQDQRMAEISATSQRSEAALAETTTLLGSIRALLTPAQETKPPVSGEPGKEQAPTVANSTRTEASEKPATVAAETPAAAPVRKRHFL